MSSGARDCEGEIVDNNMITNISMRSAKSRMGVRQAEDEPGVLTSVRGPDGSVGVTEVLLGTVCVADREMTYVRGTRPSRSSCSSTSRQRRRAVTTPPLRGTRRSSTGRVTKRRRTSTLRGGQGTSSTSQMSSAAIHWGVSQLISWAGQWGRGDSEPFKEGAEPGQWQAKRCTRADSFCAKPYLAEKIGRWKPMGEEGGELTMTEPSLASGWSPQLL